MMIMAMTDTVKMGMTMIVMAKITKVKMEKTRMQ